jgi:hypothetical protein
MYKIILAIILILATSCTVPHDYNTLSFQSRGDNKIDVLKDFNMKEKEGKKFNFNNNEFEIYFKKYFIISGNQMPGGVYDIFVFVFKDNKLMDFGVLEDFRRSDNELLQSIAKNYKEIN